MGARTDDDEHALPVRAYAQAAARTGRWERSASVHDGLEFAASVRSGTGRTPASRRALAQSETDAAVRAEWDAADDLETSFNSYQPRLGTDAPKMGTATTVLDALASSDSARSSALTTPATSPEHVTRARTVSVGAAARAAQACVYRMRMRMVLAPEDAAWRPLPLFLNSQ